MQTGRLPWATSGGSLDLVCLIGAGRKTGAGMGVSGSGELGGDTIVEGGRGVGDGSSLGANAGRLIMGGVVGSSFGGGVNSFCFGGGVLWSLSSLSS